MNRDPWADDWDADWTKATKQTASSNEIWSQANHKTTPPVDLSQVTPKIAYKPQIKILKRDPGTLDANIEAKPQAQALDSAAREARYKEARERLFGSSDVSTARQLPSSRSTTPGQSLPELAKPLRQSRGPEVGGRGGFSGRGKAKTIR